MSNAPSTTTRLGHIENVINTFSRPSDLKITGLSYALVWSDYDHRIIRIDRNQGVCGIDDVRYDSRAQHLMGL